MIFFPLLANQNMASNIGDEIINTSKSVFRGRQDRAKFVIYKISEDKTKLEIDAADIEDPMSLATKDEGTSIYAHMLNLIPETECRYILYRFDFKLETDNGLMPQDKIILLSWLPNGTKPAYKMVFASTKTPLRSKCKIDNEYCAFNQGEIQLERIAEYLNEMANIKSRGYVKIIEGEEMSEDLARNISRRR